MKFSDFVNLAMRIRVRWELAHFGPRGMSLRRMNRFIYHGDIFVLVRYWRDPGRVAVTALAWLVALDEAAECSAIFAQMCRDGGAEMADQSCKRGHAWNNHAGCHLKVANWGVSSEWKSLEFKRTWRWTEVWHSKCCHSLYWQKFDSADQECYRHKPYDITTKV